MDLKKLKDPFPFDEVEWRVKTTGKNGTNKAWAMLLPYVTNRAIMNRLDDVVGPENWQNKFRSGPTGGTMCGLTIRINNEWITKWDGAEATDIEPVKGGFSDSMKRAAVQWGIGRYLYSLDFQVKDVLPKRPEGRYVRVDDAKRDIKGYCIVPTLPDWALPDTKKKDEKDKGRNGASSNKNKKSKPVSKKNKNQDSDPLGPPIEGVTYRQQDNLVIAEGDTFQSKGLLKSAGFKWNPKLKVWANDV